MKLKKVSRVLSLVVAGAMVLAMAPAAFAVRVGDYDYDWVDSTHHHVHAVYEDGSKYDADVECNFETGTCICGNTCSHVGVQKVVDNGDGTHNVVCPTCNKVVDTAKHSYNENGKCACGATCNHMGQHFKFVANNNGTHHVLCADCDTVVSENVPCTYVDGKCQQCGATCDHMGQHFKFVANNNGTHNVLCADCDAVVSENVPCTYVDGKCQQCDATQPAPEPTPGSSVGPVATTTGLGIWLLILGGLILGFFGL